MHIDEAPKRGAPKRAASDGKAWKRGAWKRKAWKRKAWKREASKPRVDRRASSRWLIVKEGVGVTQLEPLCLDGSPGGKRLLPVFCFQEEAEMFLCLGGYGGDGWRARQSSPGELISVLYGPCADVRSVALDPLPEMLEDGTIGLVTLGRGRFVQAVLDGSGGWKPGWKPGWGSGG